MHCNLMMQFNAELNAENYLLFTETESEKCEVAYSFGNNSD